MSTPPSALPERGCRLCPLRDSEKPTKVPLRRHSAYGVRRAARCGTLPPASPSLATAAVVGRRPRAAAPEQSPRTRPSSGDCGPVARSDAPFRIARCVRDRRARRRGGADQVGIAQLAHRTGGSCTEGVKSDHSGGPVRRPRPSASPANVGSDHRRQGSSKTGQLEDGAARRAGQLTDGNTRIRLASAWAAGHIEVPVMLRRERRSDHAVSVSTSHQQTTFPARGR